MRCCLSLILALALVTPPGLAHAAGWTAEQRATLDKLIALENAGDLRAAVQLAAQEFSQATAPAGYRRAVAKRGRAAAETLFGQFKDVAHLCVAVELMRVYQAELIESAQDREDVPLELARLEAQATAAAAPCAQSPAPPPPPDPPPTVARQIQEGPDLPPAPARRSRARIAVGAGLFATSAGLVAGVAGCFVAREPEADRIAALDERATAAGRDLTLAELDEVHTADRRYARLSNTGKTLGVMAGLSLLAAVVVLALPPRARSKAQALGAGVHIKF